jgi:hypothetical protein
MEKQRTEESPQPPVPALSNPNTEVPSQTQSQAVPPTRSPRFSQMN